MLQGHKKKLLFCLIIILGGLLFFRGAWAVKLDHTYPRLSNYYLAWTLTDAQARAISRNDVVVLDMEIQKRQPQMIKKIRNLNPDIVLLVYITPQEIIKDANSSYSLFRKQLASGIKNDYYLQNSKGQKIGWWPGTHMLNVTDQDFQNYFVDFVVGDLLSSGFWDGVYYDNAWDNIAWFVGTDIDFDLNGKVDSSLDAKWRDGLKVIYNETRRITNDKYLIVGNNETIHYSEELNGMMLENFSSDRWQHWMERYDFNNSNRLEPRLNLINANTANTGSQSYQDMRFGLGSTLLEDGYFSYDYGDTNHGQTWWYDEYNVDLGEALGESESKNNYNTYQPDVWQRSFSNGLAIVNSTNQKKTVELGGEYEKIHGTQDKQINDGSIISETTIDGYDGLLLLKTFDSVNDIVFRNGDFLRFLDANGHRVRNGFFVFEEGYKGGDKIAHIDLDSNGKRDLIVVHNNRIMAWRDDGQIFMKLYPYTTSYKGELRVAVGDLNNDGWQEIYVAPSDGYPGALKVYTRHGRKMRRDRYPFGESYTGGFYLGTGDIDGYKKDELLIGAGTGVQPEVSIYNFNLDKLHEWLAYEYWFSGGVPLTGGDVNGDGIDEVIVGTGPGKKPVVRIFDKVGLQLYDEFEAYSSFGTPGVEVLSADVDFDGRDDIIGSSSGF